MTLRWKTADLADPNNDLCTQVRGVYADIVHNVEGQWHCLWNTTQRFGPFSSRDAAIAWFDQAVGDLTRGAQPSTPIPVITKRSS